ncbi:hypothetical protein F6P71_06385 [Streptococcus suis]|nr:hypothetical protein [Streptococcus suis]
MECKTRTNLTINHCAEMLTLTLRSGTGLSPASFLVNDDFQRVLIYKIVFSDNFILFENQNYPLSTYLDE